MLIDMVPVDSLQPDDSNPRKADPARTHLLSLSLSKLGFILPVAATRDGLVLSGHQRLSVAKTLGYKKIPVQYVDLDQKAIQGINILFNRVTNDFGALDTGSKAKEKLHLSDIVEKADGLDDWDVDEPGYAFNASLESIAGLGANHAEEYDKKAVKAVETLLQKGIHIPVVITASGQVVNGIHRLFAAQENDIKEWPIVWIPDELGEFANHFLNYLSMDYHVDEEFADLLRYSAYRRPQNARGSVPKAYRYWANGCRTLLDKDSYSRDYWMTFRNIHGNTMLDFGAGLCKVAPFLQGKGIDCVDFEPFRINPALENGKPDPAYSRLKAGEFLQTIAEGKQFDSIFLASVLNSVPFPRDRMCILAIVHALSGPTTQLYGTMRDWSDFVYEYGGIRQATYFVFDSEPGVRLGDSLHNPKLQKFFTEEETCEILNNFWATQDTWSGGNVHYFRASEPKRINPKVLRAALLFEFHDLPHSDQQRMGLGDEAIAAFNKRLGLKMPKLSKTEK